MPPDPLHTNYLGPVNDLMDSAEELWPIEVKSFYKTNYLNKNGEGAGGKFNGPSIKTNRNLSFQFHPIMFFGPDLYLSRSSD